MVWRTAEAIESFLEEPVGVGSFVSVSEWRFDYGEFIVRKDGVAECIFAIALLEDVTVANCFGCQQAQGTVF